MIKIIASLVMMMTFVCSSLNIASAADYWIWNKYGYNYYVVTEKSSLIDDWSAKANIKAVAPNGSVETYNLYMWEMKGELHYSKNRKDLRTKRGSTTMNHDTLAGKAYDYMMNYF